MKLTLSSSIYMFEGVNHIIFRKAKSKIIAVSWYEKHFEKSSPIKITKIGRGMLRDLIEYEEYTEDITQRFRDKLYIKRSE